MIAEKLGKGFGWTQDESVIIYKGMNACNPGTEGVAVEDMAKFKEVRNAIVAAVGQNIENA